MNKWIWAGLLLIGVLFIYSIFYDISQYGIAVQYLPNGTNMTLGPGEVFSVVDNKLYTFKKTDDYCLKVLDMARNASYNIPGAIKERCQLE